MRSKGLFSPSLGSFLHPSSSTASYTLTFSVCLPMDVPPSVLDDISPAGRGDGGIPPYPPPAPPVLSPAATEADKEGRRALPPPKDEMLPNPAAPEPWPWPWP